MPRRQTLHTGTHRLREQIRTTLNYTAKGQHPQTYDFTLAYNDVWAVPEIKTCFNGSHGGSAVSKSENLAATPAVPF